MGRALRIAVLVLVMLAAMVGTTLLWHVRERRTWFYSDADTIRQPAAHAPVRDVLWQPSSRLPDVSTEGEEYEARLSEDGQTMFFVRGKAGANADIWWARRQRDTWTDPQPLTPVNSPADDLGPDPAADGKSLYFYSDRPGGLGGYDLWISRLGESGWEAPANLGPAINSEWNDYGPALAPDAGSLFFSSNRPRQSDPAPEPGRWPATIRERQEFRDYDLYAAPLTDRGPGVAVVLESLSTDYNEGTPAFSPFGDFLYFSSDRPGGAGGFDLYRARRLPSRLEAAESLGAAINTEFNELDPALSMGGFALTFSSNRPDSAEPLEDLPSDYDLYRSYSREVFREYETTRARIDWATILPFLWWLLLPILLGLLLWLLRRAAGSDRLRQLSLLAKCILFSALIHALILLCTAFWYVGNSMQGWLKPAGGGGIRIAFESAGGGASIMSQIRGEMTELASLPMASITTSRLDAPSDGMPPPEAANASFDAGRARLQVTPAREAAPAPDAPAPAAEEPRLSSASHEAPALADVQAPAVAARAAATREHGVDVQREALAAPRAQRTTVSNSEAAPQSRPAILPASATAPVEARGSIADAAATLEALPSSGTDSPPTSVMDQAPALAVGVAAPAPGTREARAENALAVTTAAAPAGRASNPADAASSAPATASVSPDASKVERTGSLASGAGSTATDALTATVGTPRLASLPSATDSGAPGGAIVAIPSSGPRRAAAERSQEMPGVASAPGARPAADTVAGANGDVQAAAVAPGRSDVRARSSLAGYATEASRETAPGIGAPTMTQLTGAAADAPSPGGIAMATPAAGTRVASAEASAGSPAPAAPDERRPELGANTSATGGPAAVVAVGPTHVSTTAHGSFAAPARASAHESAPAVGAPSLRGPEQGPALVATPADVRLPGGQTRTGEGEASLAFGFATPDDSRRAQRFEAGAPGPRTGAGAEVVVLDTARAGAPSLNRIMTGGPLPDDAAPRSDAPPVAVAGLGSDTVRPPDVAFGLPGSARSASPDLKGQERSTDPAPFAAAAGSSSRPRVSDPGPGAAGLARLSPGASSALGVRSPSTAPATDASEAPAVGLRPATPLAGTGDTPVSALALGLPSETLPEIDPYLQRSPEARQSILERAGGDEATERAVADALGWLARHQHESGRWDSGGFDDACGECGGHSRVESDVALTGLATLCFLAADHTHAKDGPYREHVSRAVAWLVSRQSSDGDLRRGETMYSHAIAAIALGEAYGMTRDPELRPALEAAIRFIAAARSEEGGWRYEPGQFGDTSVLGWQIMALESARRAGLDVPAECFDAARDWLTRVEFEGVEGRYGYQPGMPFTPAMTAEAMFVQQLLGRERDEPAMIASASYLMENPPRTRRNPNTYYWYYGTLAMYQHQGEEWDRWNDAAKAALLEAQRDEGAAKGSWDPGDQWSRIGGRVYQTAICTLTLEVYYRYLPMYGAAR